MTRLLICGSRHWTDEAPIEQELTLLRPEIVIEGGARGADAIAKRCARRLEIPVEEYLPLWAIHGRAAGPIRNHDMLVAGKPDLVVAFSDDINNERSGSRHMCRIAIASGLQVTLVEHGINGNLFSRDLEADEVVRHGYGKDGVYP